jgi:hypothetical protein
MDVTESSNDARFSIIEELQTSALQKRTFPKILEAEKDERSHLLVISNILPTET